VSGWFQRIKFPELLFGFVAPIGAEISTTLDAFRSYFTVRGYDVIEVKVTDGFAWFSRYVAPTIKLERTPLGLRYRTHIAYGNQLRSEFGDDVLAKYAINRVVRRRSRLTRKPDEFYSRTVYLMHQFKRAEEIELLRSVYGRLFFQVSVYSRRGARVDSLSRKFANSRNTAAAQSHRAEAEDICQQDQDEVDVPHGQRVGKIFHDADFVISLDNSVSNVDQQVTRFCDLVFSSNSISPSRTEYGLFLAKAAALRTLDLSRQVGAAIFSPLGEVISLGSNEVPKATGGTYWPDDPFDDREYQRKFDSNDERKREILAELVMAVDGEQTLEDWLAKPKVRESQLMDALEYGRIIHAEMSAISDAARLGRPTKGATLCVTTFPCHMCAKHIVAAGIAEVVFLEPYHKSLTSELHSDSVRIEGADRGKYQNFPAVEFSHFWGITPRRYRELFERGHRKDATGRFVPFGTDGIPIPLMDIKAPFYTTLEKLVLEETTDVLGRALDDQDEAEKV
jgi:deoxycytidylate deaminase